jgi:hypothetical protein
VADYQSNPHPFSAQVSERIAIHICQECNNNIAWGVDADGNPALCQSCAALKKLRTARLRILPARRQARISGRRKRS